MKATTLWTSAERTSTITCRDAGENLTPALDCSATSKLKALVPLGQISFLFVYDRDNFINCEKSETNNYCNDEITMCDFLS